MRRRNPLRAALWAAAQEAAVPVALAAASAGLVAAPTPATAGAAAGAVAYARVTRRRRSKRRLYLRPTERAIRERLGNVAVSLTIHGDMAPRPLPAPSPAEAAVRRWYGTYVEPAVRWLPDRAMRGYWLVQRPLRGGVDVFRRPDPPRIKVVIRDDFLTGEQKELVKAIIAAKIPTGETVASWDEVGSTVTCMWRLRQRPPAKAGLADLEAAFAGLAEHEFFIGLTVGRRPYVISLDDDSPHIALSAGSGAGKTVVAQLLAVQVLRRGGRVTILDRKGSHRWARGLDRVTYCRTAEEMHHVLLRLAGNAERRNAEAFTQPDNWDPGPRELIIFEEMNATVSQLRNYWADLGNKGVSPAVRAFQELLFMGRSAKHNAVGIAQMLSANAALGPEGRENFGIRGLARYSKNNWKMLVDGVAMPRPSRTRGRWQFVVGGTATEVQVAFLTAAEARRFAGVTFTSRGGPDSGLSSDVTDDRDIAARMTMQDAIDEGLLPWTPEAVRQRLSRARRSGQWVPPVYGRRGRADLFERADVVRWAALEQRMVYDSEGTS